MMLALLVFIPILVFFALFLGFSQATEIEDVDFKSIKTQNVTGTKFSSNQRSRYYFLQYCFFFQFKINIILIIESPVDEVTVNPKWAQCGIGKISTQFDRKL